MYRTHLDFETRSLADLPKVGEHMYAQHSSTQPTMLQFHVPGITPDIEVEDFLTTGWGTGFAPSMYAKTIYPLAKPGDMMYRAFKPKCPPALLAAIERGDTFVAHNARFEQAVWYWICHLVWGWPMPVKWSCTAARSRYWGLRASLEGSGSDLELPMQKNPDGKEFINDFCKPRKYKGPKKDGIVKELWYEPHENPTGWAKGLQYGRDDVPAEMGIDEVLPDLPPFEQAVWELDFKMNTRGVPIDLEMVGRAKQFSDHYTQVNFKRFDEITALRPTQRDKVLDYLAQREEIDTLGDLKSKTLKRIVLTDLPADLQDVITIRLETSKASIKKLEAMERCTDKTDGTAKGVFLYAGAHTLRWTAKRVQFQNFIRGNAKVAAEVFKFLESDVWDAPPVGHNGGPTLDGSGIPAWQFEANLIFVRPLGALSQAMRGFIAAPRGKKIVTADYAQIEARVLAWLAGCEWLLEAFRNKQDPYVTFAAKYMYSRQYEAYFEYKDGKRKLKGGIFARERQVAKSAVLGCGFGLGWRQFIEYCDNMDLFITEQESKDTIKAYRSAHYEIADYANGLWARVERAALTACSNEGSYVELGKTGVTFHIHRLDSERYWLIVSMPNGSHMAYYRPKVRMGSKWGRPCEILSYRCEWAGRSYREDTYGGKMVENIVQWVARCICAAGALRVEAAGYPVVGLVHDETITLPDLEFGSHEHVAELLCQVEPCYAGLPVEAEGATMFRYGK